MGGDARGNSQIKGSERSVERFQATVNIFIVFQSCIGIERSQQPAPDCQANSGSTVCVCQQPHQIWGARHRVHLPTPAFWATACCARYLSRAVCCAASASMRFFEEFLPFVGYTHTAETCSLMRNWGSVRTIVLSRMPLLQLQVENRISACRCNSSLRVFTCACGVKLENTSSSMITKLNTGS